MAITDAPKIRGFSEPSEGDFEQLASKLARERKWYEDAEVFETYDDIEQAITGEQLVTLHHNHNIRLVQRFADHPEKFVPAAKMATRAIVHSFGMQWRAMAEQRGLKIVPVRLALTSLVRPVEQNDEIVSRGALAVSDSRHTNGAAADFDGAGYYEYKDGIWLSVGHPGREEQQQKTLEELRSIRPEVADRLHYSYDYKPEVMQAAWDVAQLMHERMEINLVGEFEGTPNATMHMAADPDFQ